MQVMPPQNGILVFFSLYTNLYSNSASTQNMYSLHNTLKSNKLAINNKIRTALMGILNKRFLRAERKRSTL